MNIQQKIFCNLWFDREAEEAVNLYTSIFRDSSIDVITRYPKAGQEIHGMPEGTVMNVSFRLAGQAFLALNGGPHFKFTEAISLCVNCKDQAEIDYFWEKLGEGGNPQAQQCGWLKDKFGLSWQIVPENMGTLLKGSNPESTARIMNAMMKMKKIVIADLENAAKG